MTELVELKTAFIFFCRAAIVMLICSSPSLFSGSPGVSVCVILPVGGLVCVVRRKEGFAGGLRVNTGSDEMVTNDGEVGSEDRETGWATGNSQDKHPAFRVV